VHSEFRQLVKLLNQPLSKKESPCRPLSSFASSSSSLFPREKRGEALSLSLSLSLSLFLSLSLSLSLPFSTRAFPLSLVSPGRRPRIRFRVEFYENFPWRGDATGGRRKGVVNNPRNYPEI